ncbi:hypothetical protein ABDK96_06815 [Citricoccus nitrophenolicus]|uniref:NifU family protein n=1 Tax=Citricoccus nitrophenolicus TaxID=863575 RepID=A0ABV0IGU4_9MICC|nr:hypothetical protein [Citricoccus sp. I39-566]NUL45614.1 hypothetical protein [Cellulosimicrobium funkei]WMY79329.1 hypothetical protein RE421_05550 [Citricoccus sp. I39-566]
MTTQPLEDLRQTLAADGYILSIDSSGERVDARISAEDGVCGDCLVPKNLMALMISNATGAAADSIDLTYPTEIGDDGQIR